MVEDIARDVISRDGPCLRMLSPRDSSFEDLFLDHVYVMKPQGALHILNMKEGEEKGDHNFCPMAREDCHLPRNWVKCLLSFPLMST